MRPPSLPTIKTPRAVSKASQRRTVTSRMSPERLRRLSLKADFRLDTAAVAHPRGLFRLRGDRGLDRDGVVRVRSTVARRMPAAGDEVVDAVGAAKDLDAVERHVVAGANAQRPPSAVKKTSRTRTCVARPGGGCAEDRSPTASFRRRRR